MTIVIFVLNLFSRVPAYLYVTAIICDTILLLAGVWKP